MSEVFFHIAAGSFVLTGLGHTSAELFAGIQNTSEETTRVLEEMKSCLIPMPGRKVSIYTMMRGFSLMMGLLLIAIGVINHLSATTVMTQAPMMGLNVAVSALGLFISIRYFFIVPIVLMGIATGAYLTAWIV